MNTLPRLKPRCSYDIVVGVCPHTLTHVQGRSVSPCGGERDAGSTTTHSSEPALRQTSACRSFQEQLMRIAVDAAKVFSAEADQLRRAMGAKTQSRRMEASKGDLWKNED